MSKYDSLDARNQLEQAIAGDLRAALEKRGYAVVHNGTQDGHAPQGLPDIVVSNRQTVLTFEETKAKGAAQDRELNSIRDHLRQVKADNGSKRCFCVFVSPATSARMIDGIQDNNRQRASEGVNDLKILPLSFDALELWLTRLAESEVELYPVNTFVGIFAHHAEFVDDLRVRKLLIQSVFPGDAALADALAREEIERDNRTLEKLIGDLARMEDYMRENGIATVSAAIDTLIYFVFLKLYEEKRERDGRGPNRLRSTATFEEYRQSIDAPHRDRGRAIHRLFHDDTQEGEFLASGMFTENDNLSDSVNDTFIMDYVIPVFSEYKFVGTRIDALGAAYEVLALRASKDVKVGQFFTPENVVHFMVALAELDYKDMVLDPACGTGRFLIYSMADMSEKADRPNVRNRQYEKDQVRLHRLFGADIDQRIAKIAKMNMWIHGDGKSNVFGGTEYNGLTLHKKGFNGHPSFDNAFDAVLTNPPLGELNYQVIPFVDPPEANTPQAEMQTLFAKFERMPVLPRKNLTVEKLTTIRERLTIYRQELAELDRQIAEAEQDERIQEWNRLEAQVQPAERRARKRELAQDERVRIYNRMCSSAESKRRTITHNGNREADLEAERRTGQVEWEITGNTMKGGAMFLAAIWHYLKSNASPDSTPEWRGGRMCIILDEGILNTDDYRDLRAFIRSHFYIKAVISLTRDTFVPVSKTATKTSILYAVKKTDLIATQKEPIFYAHAENVGLDTKGKVCRNDFAAVRDRYFDFKRKVLASYQGAEFRRERFLAQNFQAGRL